MSSENLVDIDDLEAQESGDFAGLTADDDNPPEVFNPAARLNETPKLNADNPPAPARTVQCPNCGYGVAVVLE